MHNEKLYNEYIYEIDGVQFIFDEKEKELITEEHVSCMKKLINNVDASGFTYAQIVDDELWVCGVPAKELVWIDNSKEFLLSREEYMNNRKVTFKE